MFTEAVSVHIGIIVVFVVVVVIVIVIISVFFVVVIVSDICSDGVLGGKLTKKR